MFKRAGLVALTWFASLGLVVTASAAPQYQEGEHYHKLPYDVRSQNEDKIEVVELFWYGCPHCFRFDPKLKSWVQELPETVAFRRVPAIFSGRWSAHAQAFYTAKALDKLDELHEPIFNAIHVEGNKLASQSALADFFAQHGVDQETFNKTWNSFSVQSKLKQAKSQTRSFRASGVPALIVAGQYRIESTIDGGFDAMLKVADFLLQREQDNE